MSLIDKFLPKEIAASHIVICKSLSYLLKAEKVFRQFNIPMDMIPVPRGFGSPCRTALLFPSPYKDQVENLLQENHISWQGIYPMETKPRKKDWSSVFTNQMTNDFRAIMEKARQDVELNLSEVMRLLKSESPGETKALYKAADLVRQECVGERVDIRGAIEFSNYCSKNCLYCGLRKENNQLPRYRMTIEEILVAVGKVAQMGLRTVILQSGEDPWYTTDKLLDLIKKIKSLYGLRITLSLGEREPEELKLFREAGANNYLLKIEAADPKLFTRVHPDTDYYQRMKVLNSLKKVGFLVGSGNIVGLPGQTLKQLAEDILFQKEKGIHMIGTGPFIPAANTPFVTSCPGSVDLTLKTIAIARILCQNVYIPATTALATLDKDGLIKGLKAGANTIMLVLTPAEYRASYNIYNAKKPVSLKDALEAVKAAGRKPPLYLEKRVSGGGDRFAGNA